MEDEVYEEIMPDEDESEGEEESAEAKQKADGDEENADEETDASDEAGLKTPGEGYIIISFFRFKFLFNFV